MQHQKLRKMSSNYWSIDSKAKLSCYGRYCNDPILPEKLNADLIGTDYDGDKDNVIGHVEATRDIQPGEEIYVTYGVGYWCIPKYSDLLGPDEQDYLMRNVPRYRQYFFQRFAIDLTQDD